MNRTSLAPGPGWYTDPAGAGLRYWDGASWTEHRAAQHATTPVAPRVAATAVAPDDRPQVPLPVALAATAGGVVALNLVGWVLSTTGAFGHGPRLVALVLALSLEPVCLLAPLVVWARRSRSSLVAATGFRLRVADIPRGLGIGLVSRAATVPVAALVALVSPRLLGTNTTGIDAVRDPWNVVYVVLAAVVIAPLVEEVAFRGALMPALSSRHGATAGLVLTSAIFGAAHFQLAVGVGNIGMVVILAVLGAILGSEVRQRHTLGSAIIAHALGNALVVGFLLLS